ncbi:MAG TPA: type II secretion system protein GspK [Polyangiaceae bacterium]
MSDTLRDLRTVHRRKRLKNRAKERGVALIMVLGAIAVLTVMLADFQDETSTELSAAISDRDTVQAEFAAKSAINLTRLLLATEPTIRAVITPLFAFLGKKPPQLPVWEFTDRFLGPFNDKEASKSFASDLGMDLNNGKNLGLPEGEHFDLDVVDEDAKIDLNLGASNDIAHIREAQELMALMAPIQYNPLFEKPDARGTVHDRLTICAAIIDWADTDEQLFNCNVQANGQQSGGVEDAYYQLLPKPYRRKNAPFDSFEEVHMVRGMSEDFWSTFVDPEPDKPEKRVMTVWGQGAINVNTANAQTLYGAVCAGAPTADICIDPIQASMFLSAVTMARGITMGAPLFGSSQDFIDAMKGKGQIGPLFSAIGMKPVKFLSESEFSKSITIESKMFSIYAIGEKKGIKRDTRIKIQEVVDMRAATPLTGQIPGNVLGAAAGSASATPPPAPVPSGSSSAGGVANPNDPYGLLSQTNPAGNVVYFRMD